MTSPNEPQVHLSDSRRVDRDTKHPVVGITEIEIDPFPPTLRRED
jgi:hypothetical protein